MKMPLFRIILLFTAALVATVAAQDVYPNVTIREVLGHSWGTSVVHRSVDAQGRAPFDPVRLALYSGDTRIPAQWDNLETNAAGGVRKADLWFRTDLPADAEKSFVLRDNGLAGKEPSPRTDLAVSTNGGIIEFANGRTAVRFPTPSEALFSVRLTNGSWMAVTGSRMTNNLISSQTDILAAGPIFARTRRTCLFEGGGEHAITVTLWVDDPAVVIDETYSNAGTLNLSFPSSFRPDKIVYEAFRASPDGKQTTACNLIGWNDVGDNQAPAMALVGDPAGAVIGLVSTSSDWLPRPYEEAIRVTLEKDGPPKAAGSLESGHRHWAVWVTSEAELQRAEAEPKSELWSLGSEKPLVDRPLVKILYDQWWRRFMVSLDKVVNWQLTWPDMDILGFPHTFFGKDELPGIRARLQTEPALAEFAQRCKEPDVGYLFSGSTNDLVKLRDIYRTPPTGRCSEKQNYLAFATALNIEHAGYFYYDYMRQLNLTDELLTRVVGLDLLLGSDLVTSPERRKMLSQIAFIVYLLHDTMWFPPDYPQGPIGYAQGTPNMRHCLFATRAMVACMLGNHPDKPAWIERAMLANDRVMPDSVNTNGVHLESPFYSSRDTMRFVPFWIAMIRAGAKGQGVDQWMQREKLTFQYMGDMLTPKEPRMGNRRVYHPIGRSSPGVIDPTFMIGGYPWGLTDESHGRLMRWLWQSQGKPAPDIMGTTGGRNMALTCIAFSYPFEPLQECPLKSVRWEGMGVVMRSEVDTDHESNVLFRHDPFCRELYDQNNGGVYFYGKGAPLSVRFGGYWMAQQGQPHLMETPFGNRVLFETGGNACVGRTTDYALLGDLADYAVGETLAHDWRRTVLFAKDRSKDDPVYLLVRDDVSRTNSSSAVHWWVMSKDVQPDGLEKPGVVPTAGSDEKWWANVGTNWAKPPILKGQHQFFTGQCGVDLDLFIAAPTEPKIVTDAIGVGPRISYCVNPKLYEYQQLVRIEQAAGKPYLTLLSPRWPGAPASAFRTIADGNGVAIDGESGEDRLFLAGQPIVYKDGLVEFNGTAGFARRSGAGSIRLMVVNGSMACEGIALSSGRPAGLLYEGNAIMVRISKDAPDPRVALTGNKGGTKITVVRE
jgi:hypothetical protein